MTISEINIVPVKPRQGLVAFCSFVIDNSFFVSDVAIYTRLDGNGSYRLCYPSKRFKNGTRIQFFHPINREIGEQIEAQVEEAYMALIEEQ